MSILNQTSCATSGGNTGIPDCAVIVRNWRYGFLVPLSFVVRSSALGSQADFLQFMQLAAQEDSPSDRIYPLPPIEAVTDNTEEPVSETIGGTAFFVRDGKYNLTARYVKGGNCVSNALRKFNNGNYALIIVDGAGLVVGTRTGVADELKGIPLDNFNARAFRFATDSTVTNYSFNVVFDAAYINEGIAFVESNLADMLSITGLMNINLSLVGTRTAGVFVLQAKAGCAGVNLYDQYSADLADAALYEVLNKNGLVVPITSVAVAPASKGFTFTLDTTSPNYTSGQPYTVKGAGVSALVAADVDGYEIAPPIVVA